MNTTYWLILGALGVWRITHLLSAEDVPGGILARLRVSAGSGLLGEILDCPYCLSLWVAAPFAYGLAGAWSERVLAWLALSGAASLLDRTQAPPVPTYVEEPLHVNRRAGDHP